jgi:hypothetical protein
MRASGSDDKTRIAPKINFSLEEFSNGGWNNILTNCSLSHLSDNEKSIINNIKLKSTATCESYGLPVHQIRKAA